MTAYEAFEEKIQKHSFRFEKRNGRQYYLYADEEHFFFWVYAKKSPGGRILSPAFNRAYNIHDIWTGNYKIEQPHIVDGEGKSTFVQAKPWWVDCEHEDPTDTTDVYG